MLVIDTTLVGAVMFTITDYPSIMTGTMAFLALLIVLFGHGLWMVGLLAYTTTCIWPPPIDASTRTSL